MPWLRGDLWDFDDFCSLVRSSVSYSISLHRELKAQIFPLFPLSLPLPGAGARLAPGKHLLRQQPEPGGVFGALQGFFSLLIPKQQDQRAMRVPCTRDVLPLTLTARPAGPGPPGTSFGVMVVDKSTWRGSTTQLRAGRSSSTSRAPVRERRNISGLGDPRQGLELGDRTRAFAAGRLLRQALMKLFTRACDYFFHPFVSYLLLKLILLKGTFLGLCWLLAWKEHIS